VEPERSRKTRRAGFMKRLVFPDLSGSTPREARREPPDHPAADLLPPFSPLPPVINSRRSFVLTKHFPPARLTA
jgi:hypothetical protein